MNHKIGISFVAATLVAAPAFAQSDGEATVVPGSSGSGTIAITIDSLFGTESQADTVDVEVSGDATFEFTGSAEPFGSCEMTGLNLALTDGSLSYCFFDIPIFGCTSLDLDFSNFTLNLLDPVSSDIDASGMAEFVDVEFIMSFDYDIQSTLFAINDNYTSTPKEPSVATFSFRIDTTKGVLFIDEMNMSTVEGAISEEDLPAGVDSVLTSTDVALGTVSMVGTYDPPEPADCTGDFNNDGIVDGGDFGALLSAWGPCSGCPQDLDGNGNVDGGDVGLFLALWGPCDP